MKNQVLSYVYNTMSQSDKEVYDALSLTDADKSTDENKDENEKTRTESTENSDENQKKEDIVVTNDINNDLEVNTELLKTDEENNPVCKAVFGVWAVEDIYAPWQFDEKG